MAIITESQVYVNCDFCREYYTTSMMTQKEVKMCLRKIGWTFGKCVRCPECNAEVRNSEGFSITGD